MQANAEKLVFSDSFTSDYSRWTPSRDDGRYWQLVDGQLQATINRRSTITELVPTDAVWDPNWRNILYQVDLTTYAGADRNITFNVRDPSNLYGLHFAYGQMHIAKIKQGVQVFSSSHPFAMANNTTYTIAIVFHNGTISVAIDGETLATVHDSSFTPQEYGKIGLVASTGSIYPTKVGFDNVLVYDLDQQGITVPDFKQHDPNWGDLVYDHALDWSNTPSITSWGCALTSLSMIMQAHGIQRLASGETLNPATLNQWLISQPDGYVGGGLVNFLAAMRLTKQLSDLYNTPALEYGRINYDASLGIGPAVAEIAALRPVVVQIPGHFLVADGVVGAGEDLLIKDPAFAYTQLSQHASAPLSFRTFRPSYTDLSYLLILTDDATTLSITTPENESAPPPVVESVVAYSDDPTSPSPEVIEPVTMWTVAQPTPGRYLVEVTRTEPGAYTLPVYKYEVDGSVTLGELSDQYTDYAQLFALDFQKDQPLNIRRIATFSSWQTLVRTKYEQRQFAESKVWLWLNYYTQAALNSETNSHRYPLILHRVLDWYQPLIEPSTYQLLDAELHLLDFE